MRQYTQTFLDTANEVFDIFGPVYEFEYHPTETPPPSSEIHDVPSEFDFPLLNDVDFEPKTRIDTLKDIARLPFPDGIAKTVICTDALEHVFRPHQAVEEMFRILAPGGILLFCTPTGSHSVQKPGNYWYFTPHSVQRLLSQFAVTLIGWQGADHSPHTVYGIGCKTPVCDSFIRGAGLFSNKFQQNLNEINNQLGWRQKLKLYMIDLLKRPFDQSSRDSLQTNFIVHLPVDRQLKNDVLLGCLNKGNKGTRLDLEH